MHTLNLGILAHVDAGKTSLTERLLFDAGVIDEIGSVDAGNTQTDSLAVERRRGITIKSAVASFTVGDVVINLIDTPGHPDFIAEVERVLNVLDGAVLVISAVEGVQAQTRILLRSLQRLRIPTVVFVNKIDRRGADDHRVVRDIAGRLTPAIIPMGLVRAVGTRAARFVPYHPTDGRFTARLVEALAERDDGMLAAYLDDRAALPIDKLIAELASQTGDSVVHPVYFGSAITGAGVDSLVDGVVELLPAAGGAADGPVAGTVFKVERGPAGERIAVVRLFSGTLRTRDRVFVCGDERKVTAISVFDSRSSPSRQAVFAGQIARIWGLGEVRIGDALGVAADAVDAHHFAPPTLETVVVPSRPEDKTTLHVALTQLAEQDPLINLRQDDVRQETTVSLYGEVQKEVIAETLANDFGVEVDFRDTTTICVERPAGSGAALEVMGSSENPFLATIGLRVDPAELGSGVAFGYEIELGALPLAFHRAIEATVHESLQQGLYGWQVTDCTVTLTHSGYAPRQSHAHATFDKSMSSTGADFRSLTPLVLMAALEQAGTIVHEPIHRFHLDAPADALGAILPALARLGAIPHTTDLHNSTCAIDGVIPAARVYELQQLLPALTRGESLLDCVFDRYRPVAGRFPIRPRTDHDPRDRKRYLLHVQRRV
jgi:ribosomal protection tetracycline resistance protein